MRAANALQAFLVQTLLADAAVTEIVADRVWDDIPDSPEHPYCSIGPNYHNRSDADCIRAREHYFQIDCWTRQQGRRDQVNDLTDAIEAALDGATGDLGAHALSSCDVVLVRVLDEPDGDKHGVVQVRAVVEEG
ncbi:MAG: DUF3168 domain-containing protein [Mangrovicoccus sp.]